MAPPTPVFSWTLSAMHAHPADRDRGKAHRADDLMQLIIRIHRKDQCRHVVAATLPHITIARSSTQVNRALPFHIDRHPCAVLSSHGLSAQTLAEHARHANRLR